MDAEVTNFVKVRGHYNNYLWFVVESTEGEHYKCQPLSSYLKKMLAYESILVPKKDVVEVKQSLCEFYRDKDRE